MHWMGGSTGATGAGNLAWSGLAKGEQKARPGYLEIGLLGGNLGLARVRFGLEGLGLEEAQPGARYLGLEAACPAGGKSVSLIAARPEESSRRRGTGAEARPGAAQFGPPGAQPRERLVRPADARLGPTKACPRDFGRGPSRSGLWPS